MNDKEYIEQENNHNKGLEYRKIADNTVLWTCRAIIFLCVPFILFQPTLNISLFNKFWNHFAIFMILFPAELALILDYISTRIYSHKLENTSNGDEIKSIKYLNIGIEICFSLVIVCLNTFLLIYEFSK